MGRLFSQIKRQNRVRIRRVFAVLLSFCLMTPSVSYAAGGNFYGQGNQENGQPPRILNEENLIDTVESATKSDADKSSNYATATPNNASSSDALYDEDGLLIDGIIKDDVTEPVPGMVSEKITAKKSQAELSEFCQTAVIDGIAITVKAPEGVFPADAELSVNKVTDEEETVKIDEAIGEEKPNDISASASFKFDIKVFSNGEEIEPDTTKGTVQVSFGVDKKLVTENAQINVFHVSEEKEILKAEVLEKELSDEAETLLSETMDNISETTEAEELENKTFITVETDSFSFYVVEFTYNNLEYVLEGGKAVYLSEILASLGITGEVESVTVSNSDLFRAEKESDGWMVFAMQAFTSEEWMDVVVREITYRIKVTDSLISGTAFEQKVQEFKNSFPVNAYWRSANGDNPATYTTSITGSGNFYDGAWQCNGYAKYFFYRVYGYKCTSAQNIDPSTAYPTSDVMIGDYLRIGNNEHSIFITDIYKGSDGNTYWHVAREVWGTQNNIIKDCTYRVVDGTHITGGGVGNRSVIIDAVRRADNSHRSAVGLTNITSGQISNQNVVKPSITNIEIVETKSSGYLLKATVKKGTYDISRVTFPIWTDKNGQDDIEWRDAEHVETIDANTKKYWVWVSDCWHGFEKGVYHCHVYAYDTAGNYSMKEAQSITLSNTGVRSNTLKTTWNGHTYYYVEDNLSWDAAKAACERAGGHLATITSAEEYNAVVSGMTGDLARRNQLYLGGKISNGKVQWVTGESASYPLKWDEGQPDNANNNEPCLTVYTGFAVDYPARPKGTFNDFISNSIGTGYILEIDPKVTSVSLNQTALQLNVGATSTLVATVLPSNAVNKTVTWSSSNTSIATVSSSGTVKGIAPGTATITVRTNDGGYTAKCTVTVKQPVTGVSLNKSSTSLNVGATETLIATIAPSNASNKAVTWTSSNTSVATVSARGVVTGKTTGTSKITVKTADGGYTATCKVTVVIPVTSVRINTNARTIQAGKTFQLAAWPQPSNATNKAVTWSSSDTSVAMVDSTGLVTAVKNGKAVITVKTKDGGYTNKCQITVGIPVTSVVINTTYRVMEIGQTFLMKAWPQPVNAADRSVAWTSSDPSVVTVSADGLIKTIKTGSATITAKTVDGGYTVSCFIVSGIAVTSVVINTTAMTVAPGKTFQMAAWPQPVNAADRSVKWSSSDPAVASVSVGGLVTGVKTGSATITATTVDGGYTAKCKITVGIPVTSVKINTTARTMTAGSTFQMAAWPQPTNATDRSVTWSSSNTGVAKVSSTGLVTAVKKGTATITVKTKDGGYTQTCKITVQ